MQYSKVVEIVEEISVDVANSELTQPPRLIGGWLNDVGSQMLKLSMCVIYIFREDPKDTWCSYIGCFSEKD